MEIFPVEAALTHADGQNDVRADTAKVTGVFRDYAKDISVKCINRLVFVVVTDFILFVSYS
jgi:hypothetical protein